MSIKIEDSVPSDALQYFCVTMMRRALPILESEEQNGRGLGAFHLCRNILEICAGSIGTASHVNNRLPSMIEGIREFYDDGVGGIGEDALESLIIFYNSACYFMCGQRDYVVYVSQNSLDFIQRYYEEMIYRDGEVSEGDWSASEVGNLHGIIQSSPGYLGEIEFQRRLLNSCIEFSQDGIVDLLLKSAGLSVVFSLINYRIG